jgi:hypothetical protein
VRARAQTKLAALLGTHEEHPLPWLPTVQLVAALARAFAVAESRGLFPGLLRPSSVVIEPEVWLLADEIVYAAVGAQLQSPHVAAPARMADPGRSCGPAGRTRARIAGCSGTLVSLAERARPFAGWRAQRDRSPRARCAAAAGRDRPRAAAGSQSLMLRILAPDPAQRPNSAAAIHEELTRFVGAAAPVAQPQSSAAATRDRAVRAARASECPRDPAAEHPTS